MHEIIEGDCLEVMKSFPDNHFTGIVTDPPYGLSFMGKGWDHAVPGIEYWSECLRISKPGSFLLSMGGARTFHHLACAIEEAGFQIRDCISWIYASGFPKSHNHFGFEGYGTSLKPAWEPCILAMKPLDGTFAQNAEKWGVAGLNIDACRINTNESLARPYGGDNNIYSEFKMLRGTVTGSDLKGRWPANVMFDEEAAKKLDEQTSNLKCGHRNRENHKRIQSHNIYSAMQRNGNFKDYGDSGGASRFFYCAKASSRERNEGLEGLPESPIRHDDRRPGSCDIFNTEGCGRNTDNKPVKNFHPTVKPLKLMEYLIKLIAPPQNALILDPFAGSGTTILAAKRIGISAIGIEKCPEYVEIARKRVESYDQYD